MTVVELIPTKKREITSGTKEWADHNVNCIKGCFNNCRYCYAKIMAKRFGRCKGDAWQNMLINQNAVNKEYGKFKGRVMFPSTHDIIDEPEIQEACFIVIDKLLQAGNEVLITTKPKLSVTKEIIKRFHMFREQLQFRFTITSIDDQLLSFWEPNAPLFKERFASLKYAYENNFKTSVSIEPFLDYAPQVLINNLEPLVTESIWLGPMNYIPSSNIPESDMHYFKEVRDNYLVEHLQELYKELRNNPLIRFKDSMMNRINSGLFDNSEVITFNC